MAAKPSITIITPFKDVITLIQTASSQDVTLINETSPVMVRFLCPDNTFRTIQVTDEENGSISIKLTSYNDSEVALEDFKEFLVVERKRQRKLKEDSKINKGDDLMAKVTKKKVTKKKVTKKKVTKKKVTKKK